MTHFFKLFLPLALIYLPVLGAEKVIIGPWTYTINPIINTFNATNMTTKEITISQLPKDPRDLIVHNNVAYIACSLGDTVVALDLATYKQKELKCKRPNALCAYGNKLYITEYTNQKLLVVGLGDLKVQKKVMLPGLPSVLEISNSTDYLAILYHQSDTIGIVTTKNDKQTRLIKTAGYPCGICFYGQTVIYTTHHASEIGKIDCATGTITKKLKCKGTAERLHIDGEFAYVLTKTDSSLEIYRCNTLDFVRTHSFGKSYINIGFSENGLYGDCTFLFPFYPFRGKDIEAYDKRSFSNITSKEFTIDFKKKKHSLHTVEELEKSTFLEFMKQNPGFLQSIAYDSFPEQEVLATLDPKNNYEKTQDLLDECMRVILVALWYDRPKEAQQLFDLIFQDIENPKDPESVNSKAPEPVEPKTDVPLIEGKSSQQSSTSSTKLNNLTLPLFDDDDDKLREEMSKITHLRVDPTTDLGHFPVAGVDYRGYKILSNYYSDIVTFCPNKGTDLVDVPVGHHPTLLLAWGPIVVAYNSSDQTLSILHFKEKRVLKTKKLKIKAEELEIDSSGIHVRCHTTNQMQTIDHLDFKLSPVTTILKSTNIKDHLMCKFRDQMCPLCKEKEFGDNLFYTSNETVLRNLKEANPDHEHIKSIEDLFLLYAVEIPC